MRQGMVWLIVAATALWGGPLDEAIEQGLQWLARHQTTSGPHAGSWAAKGFAERCVDGGCTGPGVTGVGPGRGAAAFDVGVSSLATLAFLGNGNTHKVGAYKRTLRKALDWLSSRQDPQTGAIGFDPARGATMYNHALATMALCEAYSLTLDYRLEETCTKAVDFCIQTRNVGLGWGCGVRTGTHDSSLTGWMVYALKTAHVAGFEVPDACFEGARGWFAQATEDPDGDLQSGPIFLLAQEMDQAIEDAVSGTVYDSVVESTASRAALSTIAGLVSGVSPDEHSTREAVTILLSELPAWEEDAGRNFFYWYHGSFALMTIGGTAWERWSEALLSTLLENQRGEDAGDARGSWDPIGEWSLVGGRVYATAINLLSLEIKLRFDRARERDER